MSKPRGARYLSFVPAIPSIEYTVYPDACDAFGHLGQAALLTLFERARWDALATGPGMDVFARHGTWPALRKSVVEYQRQALPGDRLQFDLELLHHGYTSFRLRQTARRAGEETAVATAEFVFVCLDQDGRPIAVPPDVSRFFGARPPRRTGIAQHFSVRGLSLAAEVTGDGPAVLLVHGFPLDRSLWKHVLATLTGWKRIVPDLRGFGLSDAPESGYSMTAYAEDLVALLDVLRIDRAVVCGLSMGGYIAFELLRRHPDRVSGLILMNTRAGADTPEGRADRDAAIARVHRDGPAFLADTMMPKLLAPSSLAAMPDVVRQVEEMVRRATPSGVAGALVAMRDRPDSSAMLDTIARPTLVVAGSDDQLIPVSEARAMANAIPEAHLAIIPAAGHLTPLEQPVGTSRVLREFLEAQS